MSNPKIVVDNEVKKHLDKMKIHPRETYNDIIRRLLKIDERMLKKKKRKNY